MGLPLPLVAPELHDASRALFAETETLTGFEPCLVHADLGPEHTFPVPAGILRGQGQNTIAIAAWGLDNHAGLGSVRLVSLGTYASSLQVHNVNAPGYSPRLYSDG